jgi:hypothetical protein
MTDCTGLERRYRRLLASYPRAFRREHQDEMLAVLLTGARDGQRRPGVADVANLVRSGLGMRLRPGAPRSVVTVFAAVRVMYLGAAVELGTIITVFASLDSLRAAIAERTPGYTSAQWHAELLNRMVPLVIAAAIACGVWLWMAWANGRGHRWGRVTFAAFFGLTTISLLSGLAEGAATYAPADLIAGVVLWVLALAAVVLIFNRRSGGYYRQAPTER